MFGVLEFEFIYAPYPILLNLVYKIHTSSFGLLCIKDE